MQQFSAKAKRLIVEALEGRVLEAMSREPANGENCLAPSGLGQTQIIGELIGGSEEGKLWEFGSTISCQAICTSMIEYF